MDNYILYMITILGGTLLVLVGALYIIYRELVKLEDFAKNMIKMEERPHL